MNLPDLSRVREFAFDFETWDPELTTSGPGFVKNNAKVIGLAVYLDSGYSEYFPLRHSSGNIDFSQLRPWLAELFGSELRTAIAANWRYDSECLWSLDIINKTWAADVQVLDALLDEEQNSYSLASLCKRYGLPAKQSDIIDDALRGASYTIKNKTDWTKLFKLSPELVGKYAKYDAKSTYDIYQLQKPKLAAEELLEVAELESELMPVLSQMRIEGVPVDLIEAERFNEELKSSGEEMLKAIRQFKANINPFSPSQLGDFVRECGFIPDTTEKGNDSVSNEYLLGCEHPMLKLLGTYRQQEKIRRDFVEGMVLETSYKGILHPQWFQTRGSSFMSGDDVGGTRSGRIACSDPNLSQIPSRHPVLGPKVRSLFVPHKGEKWFKGDLSQQEPRISLHYAYLLRLTGAVAARDVYLKNPNTDYHTMTMDMVNAVRSIPIIRKDAKTINLGVAYGMGKAKLAASLGLSVREANVLLSDYNDGFPFMKELLNATMEIANKRGFVRTILGRKRRFDMWEPASFQRGKFPIRGFEAASKAYGAVRRAKLHKAMNSVVQGTAAEQMKKTLVTMYKEKINCMITLYDEVGSSIGQEKEAERIKEIAESVIKFEVPQVMEYKLLNNWGGT